MSGSSRDKQVVLITGASSGIGFETAVLLSSRHKVIATVRDQAHIRQLQEKMAEAGVSFDTEILDVQDEGGIWALTGLIRMKYGRIDAVVNTIGYGLAGPVEETSCGEAIKQFDIHFFGIHRVVRAVLPLMRIQKSGLIINLSSNLGKPVPMTGFWSASQAAIQVYSEALREEVAPFGITVHLISQTATTGTLAKKLEIAVNSFSEHSPYYPLTRKALQSIRELTGKDAASTALAARISALIEGKTVR